jgi:hypothetical protein
VADWTYQLADLRTGAVTAEIELTGVRISQRLNAAGTMNGTWAVPNTWQGGSPYTLTTPARTMGVALRDGRPMWAGVLWTRRPNADKQTVELGFSDFWSYFDARFVLPPFTPNGTTSQVSQMNTTFGQVEQNDIARQLLAQAQAHVGGDLGIVADTTISGIVRDRTYAGHELVDVGTALKQLAEVIDGPDIMFGVAPELDTNGRVVKLMRIGDPRLGQDGSAHVFELGANALGYTWGSDGTRMATRAYASGEGIEAGQLIATAEHDVRHSDGWPLLEAETSFNTVSSDSTLQEHADAELRRNWLPVVTPTLTVDGSGLDAAGRQAFPAIGEVNPGDQVRCVLRDWFFAGAGIDTVMRIVAVDVEPEGVESMTLTLNPVLDDLV